MTPEQQRIAIAEACGWKQVELEGTIYPWFYKLPEREIDRACSDTYLPDYLNDLNAMNEAEKVLKQDMNGLWYPYCKLLHQVTYGLGEGASAYQRAPAFLKTLGKWSKHTK